MATYYRLQSPDWGASYDVYGQPGWGARFGLAEWTDSVILESVVCPAVAGHQRAGARSTALTVVLPAARVGDFVWTWYSDCLVTDSTLDLFEKAGFTGFEAQPVRVEGVKRAPRALYFEPPRLWELRITGKGGNAAPESGIRILDSCVTCGWIKRSHFTNGLIVDEGTWDGSDFFTVTEYPTFILVTERVKDFIIRNRLVNCALVPAQDLAAAS